MVTMAIRAGSRSLFNAHTPSGCPQHLHTLFKAFQGRGCLTQLHSLVPQGPYSSTRIVPPLCFPGVLAKTATWCMCSFPQRHAGLQEGSTEQAGCYTAPRWLLRVTGHGFPPHFHALSLPRALLAKYSR